MEEKIMVGQKKEKGIKFFKGEKTWEWMVPFPQEHCYISSDDYLYFMGFTKDDKALFKIKGKIFSIDLNLPLPTKASINSQFLYIFDFNIRDGWIRLSTHDEQS